MAYGAWTGLAVWLVLGITIGSVSGEYTVDGCERLGDRFYSVEENAAINSVIFRVNSASYLSVEKPKGVFEAIQRNKSTWEIKLISSLDLEKTEKIVYDLVLKCTPVGKSKPYPYTPQLAVTAVDEFPLVFSKDTDNIIVDESTRIGTEVYKMQTNNPAQDKDFAGVNINIQYGIVKGSEDKFEMVDRVAGNITLIKPLDYEDERVYTLNISAVDFSNTDHVVVYTTLIINVRDVDDQNPQFTQHTYQLHFKEGTYTPTQCFTTDPPIKAKDGDTFLNQEITYAMTEENEISNRMLSIDQANGSICAKGHVERGSYFLNIKAMQTDKPDFRLALAVVNVTVIDVNDHAPMMSHAHYQANVTEDTAKGSIVLALAATDEDEGLNGQCVFHLTGTGSDHFEVFTDGTQTFLTVAKQLDREHTDVYKFEVYAQDQGSPKQSSPPSTIKMYIMDVNDNTPVFEATRRVNLKDNSTRGTPVAQVKATDPDLDQSGMITYSILASPGSDLFTIDPQSGEIILNCSHCLDPRDITLILQATDHGLAPRSSLTTLPISVIQTSYAPPTFTEKVYNVSVPENKRPGFLIKVQAEDADDPDSHLQYSIDPEMTSSGTDIELSSLVSIDSRGNVAALVEFDAEKTPSFWFGVTVSDGHSTDHARVHVTVTDINEFPPNITLDSMVYIPENVSIGTVVTTYFLSDQDPSNDGFTAWLGEGSDGKFQLDLIRNAIVTTSLLDRSVKNLYTITFHATDHGQPPRSTNRTFQITVTDSNTAPVFVSQNGSVIVTSYSFELAENVTIGSKVGVVKARDPDTGSSGLVRFHLVSITPSDDFDLDQRTGELRVKRRLNFETIDEYNLTVNATDKSLYPKHAEAAVRITIVDVAERPVWPSTHLQVYITQSEVCDTDSKTTTSSSGKDVTVLVAQSNEPVFYRLLNMTGNFHLERMSGLLVNNVKLPPGNHVIGVEACSNNTDIPLCSPAAVTVLVRSDSVLTFCEGFYNKDVKESVLVGTELVRLSVNKHGQGTKYSIKSGNEDGSFALTEDEGILKTAKLLDRETTSRYGLIVIATAGQEEATAQVIIAVQDEPDTAPTFPTEGYWVRVQENEASDTQPVVTVTADDDDTNTAIRYSLVDDVNKTFSIDRKGHVYVIKPLDYEAGEPGWNHSITLQVTASDSIFTAQTQVIVMVTDVNDEYPKFDDVNKEAHVLENITTPHPLLEITATDPDTNDRIVYSLKMLKPKGQETPFFIHPLSGQLEVRLSLDREVTPSYTLQVTAEDSAHHKTTTTVVIVVDDVNDHRPECATSGYTLSVTEGPQGLGTELSISVVDEDQGEAALVTAGVTSGTALQYFTIKKNGSQQFILKTVKAIPWTEENSEMSIGITLTNDGSPQLQGTCNVTVTINDRNDHPPVFAKDHYTCTVSEDASNDTLVCTDISVTDLDSPKYGQVSVMYTMADTNTNLPFRVNNTGGLFVKFSPTTVSKFDRETTPEYNITVVVTDEYGKGLSSNCTVTIIISDVDDTSPKFKQTPYEFTIPENAPFGTGVGTVSATDADTSTDVIYYTMETEAYLPFALGYKTGKLSVVAKLEFDVKHIYVINVSASDGLHKTFVDVVVTVTGTSSLKEWCPLNVSHPIFLTVNEHQPIGEVFGSVTTGEWHANISYRVDNSDLKSIFKVNSSGDIFLLQSALTLEFPLSFDLLAIPKEDGTHRGTCMTHVTVRISRTNDFPPELCLQDACGVQTFEFLTADDSPVGSIIGQIVSRDNDTGTDGHVEFHIRSVPAVSRLFSIDEVGVIRLANTIQMKDIKDSLINQDIIVFEVTATDGGKPPRSTSGTVHVRVMTDTLNLPTFDNTTYVMSLDEELNPGAFVGKLSVTSTYQIKYSLADPNLPFKIDANTSDIRTTAKLDREKVPTYRFVVIATVIDNVPQYSAVTQVTVTLNDVNDNSPVFTYPTVTHPGNVTVNENTLLKDVVTVTAEDPDQGNNALVLYSFVKQYPNFFINSTTGAISIIKKLDRELTQYITLGIKATDQGKNQQRTSTATVGIVVRDLNDHKPEFQSRTYTRRIPLERDTDYTKKPIMDMNATDADAGESGKIYYSLLQSDDKSVFRITSFGGQIYSIFPELTIGQYNLTVMVTDSGVPPLNSTAHVFLFVTDSYMYSPPTLSLTPSKVRLFVGMTQGLDLNVSIHTNNAREVRLADDNDTPFKLSTNNRVILNQDLKHSAVYKLSVVAVNTENFNVTRVLEIQILPLQFDQPVYIAQIPENHEVPFIFMDLQSVAERESIVPVRYSLNTHTNFFQVSPTGGNVTLTRTLDREKVAIMTLNVTMELMQVVTPSVTSLDGGLASALDYVPPSAEATITVYVTDVNDHAPSFAFPGSTLFFELPANVANGDTITVLKAFDADVGSNSLISYKISSGNNNKVVSLSKALGVLTLADAAALRSNGGHVTLLVEACDVTNSLMCDNVTVEIHLSDALLRLVIPVSHTIFLDNQDTIMRELGELLGYRLDFVKSDVNLHEGVVDATRADIFFRAYTLDTNQTISSDVLSDKVSKNQEKFADIFKDFLSVKKASVHDFSDTAAIALIAVAGGIFLASFVAVFIVCRLYKKQKQEQRKVESAQRARHNAGKNGKGASSSDPDEPLELDLDLDDSSLFNGRLGDMKRPYITIARRIEETETTFITSEEPRIEDEEGSNATRGPSSNGGAAVSRENGHAVRETDRNGEELSESGKDRDKDVERGVVNGGRRDQGYDNPSMLVGDIEEDEDQETRESKSQEGDLPTSHLHPHAYDNIAATADGDVEDKIATAGDDNNTREYDESDPYEQISDVGATSPAVIYENEKAAPKDMNNYIRDLLDYQKAESQKESTKYTPLNNFVAQALGSADDVDEADDGKDDGDDKESAGNELFRKDSGDKVANEKVADVQVSEKQESCQDQAEEDVYSTVSKTRQPKSEDDDDDTPTDKTGEQVTRL